MGFFSHGIGIFFVGWEIPQKSHLCFELMKEMGAQAPEPPLGAVIMAERDEKSHIFVPYCVPT